jgi:hypothetical protein
MTEIKSECYICLEKKIVHNNFIVCECCNNGSCYDCFYEILNFNDHRFYKYKCSYCRYRPTFNEYSSYIEQINTKYNLYYKHYISYSLISTESDSESEDSYFAMATRNQSYLSRLHNIYVTFEANT